MYYFRHGRNKASILKLQPSNKIIPVPWLLIVCLTFVLLFQTVWLISNKPLQVASPKYLDLTPPPRGHLHHALFQQGIAHDEFHLMPVKARLASFVRKFNHLAIVGVEGGHEVIDMSKMGYRIDAFEPMSRYLNMVRKWSVRDLVIMHHCAAGNVTGGEMIAEYKTGEVDIKETVPRKRVDDVITTGLDVLSVDIQGGEWYVVQGAERIVKGAGIRMMWIEIQPCNERVPPMLKTLDEWGYAIFDMVPYGGPNSTPAKRMSAFKAPKALGHEWNERPSSFEEYFEWMCTMKSAWKWLQTDLLVVRRDLLSSHMMMQLNTLSNDVLNMNRDILSRVPIKRKRN